MTAVVEVALNCLAVRVVANKGGGSTDRCGMEAENNCYGSKKNGPYNDIGSNGSGN